MEEMIWFFRVFFIFSLVLGIAIYSKTEISLAQSTNSSQKLDNTFRLLTQAYAIKALANLSPGSIIEGRANGEDVKLEITEYTPNQKISWEIKGISHIERLVETHALSEKENQVLLKSEYILQTKTDPVSRLIFLFFGELTLQARAKAVMEIATSPK
jgi:hypothetical protein